MLRRISSHRNYYIKNTYITLQMAKFGATRAFLPGKSDAKLGCIVNIDSPRFVFETKIRIWSVSLQQNPQGDEGFLACEFSGRTFEWPGTITGHRRADFSGAKPEKNIPRSNLIVPCDFVGFVKVFFEWM